MTSLNSRSSNPIVGADERRLVLECLPETVLVAMIGAQSTVQNISWLSSVLQGGYLDTKDETKGMSRHADLESFCESWSERVKAATQFMTGISVYAISQDRVFGPIPDGMGVAGFGAPEEFKSFFREATTRILEQHARLTAHLARSLGANHSLNGPLDRAMATWMAAAITLDLPDLVWQIARARVASATATFDLRRLGSDVSQYVLPASPAGTTPGPELSPTIQVSPVFVAISLSRLDCFDALMRAGVAPTHPIGLAIEGGKTQSFGISTMGLHVVPLATPEMLCHVTRALVSHATFLGSPEKPQLMSICHEALSSGARMPWLRDYIPALTAAGVFGLEPDASLKLACQHGHPDIVDAVATKASFASAGNGIGGAWGMIQLAATEAARAGEPRREQLRQGILRTLDHAAAAGHLGLATSCELADKSSGKSIEPIFSIAKANLHDVLLRFLEGGFDADRRLHPSAPTLSEFAAKESPSCLTVIRTHQARARLAATRTSELRNNSTHPL